MNFVPRTKSAWTSFLLFPFKAYVIVALPLALLIPNIEQRHGNNENLGLILPGYLVCFGVLVIGAILQFFSGAKRQGVSSVIFAAASLLACLWPGFRL